MPLAFSQKTGRSKTSPLYRYISDRRKQLTVQVLCKVLGTSESGYYQSLRNPGKPKRREHLLVKIKEIINQHEDNDNYGAQRVHLALTQAGEVVSYSTIYRLMKETGLLKKPKHHPNGTTREDAEAQKSENLIQRDFTASAPNQKWLSDIFENACKARSARGMTFHSDRGSQFTSHAFRENLSKYGAIQSMSSTGRCYDNARMESFWATLKKESIGSEPNVTPWLTLKQ